METSYFYVRLSSMVSPDAFVGKPFVFHEGLSSTVSPEGSHGMSRKFHDSVGGTFTNNVKGNNVRTVVSIFCKCQGCNLASRVSWLSSTHRVSQLRLHVWLLRLHACVPRRGGLRSTCHTQSTPRLGSLVSSAHSPAYVGPRVLDIVRGLRKFNVVARVPPEVFSENVVQHR